MPPHNRPTKVKINESFTPFRHHYALILLRGAAMSLTKSLHDLGRPVVFYPRLGRFFGSNNAAILFSHLSYWQDRTENPDGVYKPSKELEEGTGLTRNEQAGARKILVSRGYLHEKNDRQNHRFYFRIDFEKVDSDFSEWTVNPEFRPAENQHRPAENQHRPAENRISYKEQRVHREYTKSTTDIKDSTPAACPQPAVAKPAAFDASAWLAQRGVSDDVAADWLAVRKSKRARNSERAFGAIERAANAAGKDLTAWWRQEHGAASGIQPTLIAIAVEASATYGWVGFDAAWLRNKLGAGSGNVVSPASWSDREQDRRESVLSAFGVVARHKPMPIADALDGQGRVNFDLLGDCDHDD